MLCLHTEQHEESERLAVDSRQGMKRAEEKNA